MSKVAFEIYKKATQEQHTRNEARRIRTRVTEARQNPHPASLRWPFELLQNALDAGPRKGRSSITIRLRREHSKVVFEHDGAPFTSLELAALLSGGSSKEFESEVTTGRFGTGFLVTHVLAERTALRGLLEVEAGYEEFDLILDRGGDEDAILENIQSCDEAIRAATPVTAFEGFSSASFEYPVTDDNVLSLGFDALREALPFLYVTRKSLGRVELETEEHGTEVWAAGEILRDQVENGCVEYRSLHIEHNGRVLPEIRVFRFMRGQDTATALVLVGKTKDGWKVRLPEPGAPKIYREYPLRGSGFLPISFVLDGKFVPDQERSRPLMSDEDKRLLQDALAASVMAVKYAFSQKWEDAHQLGRVSKPTTVFDPTDATENQWWTEHLSSFAKQLAMLPIVECETEFLPAVVVEGIYADFVIPRLLLNSTEDETTVERMWPLVEAATDLFPPRKELAADWTEIAEGWHGLGIELNRVSVNILAKYVRDEAETLAQLHVAGTPQEWLACFLDIVGECWSKRSSIDLSVVIGMLPNQNQRLCSPKELRRDSGVSERLKDICTAMGYDVRSLLLFEGFDQIAEAGGLTYVSKAIIDAVERDFPEKDIIGEAVKHLDTKLPEGEDCDDRTSAQQKASVRLLRYLWELQEKDTTVIASRIPLITSKQRAARWSSNRMMMAPVCSWRETARPFANAYPPDRVLADMYAGSEDEGIPNCVSALVEWGIAIADPIATDTPTELNKRRLAAISSEDVDGVVVSGEKFSQIALLPDVLNRCQERIEEARALLGLVLCHVVRHDHSWQENRIVKGRKVGKDVDVPVRGALWLADLKFRAWVPVPEEDDKFSKMTATATTLKELLDPAWLENNDAAIRLLSECFGFDQLELRLLGIAPDAQERQELRNGLAKLVEIGGANPAVYTALAHEVESQRRRSRDVDRCRRFGLAIQDAIKSAMEICGLKLSLIDRGFDYEVELLTTDVLDDAATKCEVGPYLLEVKATTKGDARLTPTQAETASKEQYRYVLCVVDLRNVSEEELDADWTAAKVEPLAKIVSDIGGQVEPTYLLVEEARTSSVSIRNEAALRYEVPISVWETGVSIPQWVAEISKRQSSPDAK